MHGHMSTLACHWQWPSWHGCLHSMATYGSVLFQAGTVRVTKPHNTATPTHNHSNIAPASPPHHSSEPVSTIALSKPNPHIIDLDAGMFVLDVCKACAMLPARTGRVKVPLKQNFVPASRSQTKLPPSRFATPKPLQNISTHKPQNKTNPKPLQAAQVGPADQSRSHSHVHNQQFQTLDMPPNRSGSTDTCYMLACRPASILSSCSMLEPAAAA
jgi:hypothetical protein